MLRFDATAGAPVVTDPIDVAADGVVEREFRSLVPPERVYLPFQVDRRAAPRGRYAGPRYPIAFRDRGLPGRVLAQYVVGASGRAREGSFSALTASDPAFAASIATWLDSMRFVAADRDARRVARVVRHWVTFTVVRVGLSHIAIDDPLPLCPGQ